MDRIGIRFGLWMREALSGGYTGKNSASVNQSKLSLALVSNQESSPCLSVSPMPFSVAHPIEMDRIPPARIEYGSDNFCLSEFAEADVAEGCGAER